MSDQKEITDLLIHAANGNGHAYEELVHRVYDELRGLARHYLQQERACHTLEPTALVHEAYLRLVDQKRARWKNRAQFFHVAAGMMRRVLVDHARRRAAKKRGGGAERLPITKIADLGSETDTDLIAIDEALEEFAILDPRKCKIVELRFFAGLTMERIGRMLDLPTHAVEREWITARAWLFRKLGKGEEGGSRKMEEG
jgi:RNA polymerase sigma factor (TIGR02999 family)